MLKVEPEPNLSQADADKLVKEREEREIWLKKNERLLNWIKDDSYRNDFVESGDHRWHTKEVEKRTRLLSEHGYWGDGEHIYFVNQSDGNGYKVSLTEELYQSILRAIKRASPAQREAAKRACQAGSTWWPSKNWSEPSRIDTAARLAGIDVRKIILDLCQERTVVGVGSEDDGVIYILKHAKEPIVKIGKTKALAAGRAANYTIAHDDRDGWIVHHEVNTRNVSAVEARIHEGLSPYRASYGFNAKEVFAVPVAQAMKAVYTEIEL